VVVPYVTIYMTAQNEGHQFVTTLKADDLVLKENGIERPITELTNYMHLANKQREPISIFFLMDSSESMGVVFEGNTQYNRTKEIATGLLDDFEPGDQMMVTAFNEDSWILSEMTQDTATIAARLQQDGITKGRTALYDALMGVLKKAEDVDGRKIVILCSDGDDNFSRTSLDELLFALKSSNVVVISFGSNSQAKLKPRSRKVLEKITQTTGGHAFFLNSTADSIYIVDELVQVMTSQYALGFFPSNPSRHGWRDLEIKCKVDGVRLQYRKSYLF
jgi:Ca-activated chloride channel family protein